GAAAVGLAVEAVGDVVADLAAPAGGAEGAFLGAAAAGDAAALGVLRLLGDDVDDAVDGVGAPDGGAGTADDLDAVDVLEVHVLRGPEDAREEGGVDAAAVDEDQELVGEE